MKKNLFLFATATFFALNAKCQKIDTTAIPPYPVAILTEPFYPNWQDTSKATYLNVSITSDNLQDYALFHWVLFSSKGVPLQMGDTPCKVDDYYNWNGNNVYPFQFVAKSLNLQLKN